MERFGAFVLLDEIETSGLGVEYRAAMLSPAGLDKIVSLLRLGPTLAGSAVMKTVMEEAVLSPELQHSTIVAIHPTYMAWEYVPGKSLKAVFDRCRREGSSLDVHHSLLLCSKICAALEAAQARRAAGGLNRVHGLLHPGNVFVSYQGDVRLRGFGFWSAGILAAGGLTAEEASYLAPEQSSTGVASVRSDVYMVGEILFEALTGRPFAREPGDVEGRLAAARLGNPTSDDDTMPETLAVILKRSLAVEPATRYGRVHDLKREIDTLLFALDPTSTTASLDFVMHTLFREDLQAESRALRAERAANYDAFLNEEPAEPAAPPQGTARVAGDALQSRPKTRAAGAAVAPTRPEEAATGRKGLRSRAALASIAALLLLMVGAGYLVLAGSQRRVEPAATTPAPPDEAVIARLRELEEKLRVIEAQKAALEAQAGGGKSRTAAGKTPAPTAGRPEEDARTRALADQERALQEERTRLRAESARAVASAAPPTTLAVAAPPTTLGAAATPTTLAAPPTTLAAAAPPTTLPAAAPPTTLPAAVPAGEAPAPAPPTTLPAPPARSTTAALPSEVRPGTLVNLGDPGVVAPVAEKLAPLVYPPLALRQKIGGRVELNVLVDEKGAVADARVVTPARGLGLNEAALENVRKARYRPATKDGVPVKVWMAVSVVFKLP
jgi:TonB family protein